MWLKYDIKRAIQIHGFAIFPLHNDSKICKAKDNAIESNKQLKQKPDLPAPGPKDDCDAWSQTREKCDPTNQDSGLDTGKDLLLKNIDTDNGSILNKKENKGRIQPLERVETDDCTSIDTSTLPLPPDEMLATAQNSDPPFQERFIA